MSNKLTSSNDLVAMFVFNNIVFKQLHYSYTYVATVASTKKA